MIRASLALLLVLAACGGSAKSTATQKDTLTERQRDSILAQSKLPNAAAIGKAMKVADSTSAHIRAADTAQ
jgi:hypothetical protein